MHQPTGIKPRNNFDLASKQSASTKYITATTNSRHAEYYALVKTLLLASINVGFAYDRGWGVTRDYEQARTWYTKAADAGNPHGCNILSLLYYYGKGCPANKELAIMLRRKSVENGCWMACSNLGQDYAYGQNGVTKNIPEAVRLFNKSIELQSDGNQYANYELGRIYEIGLAGKADIRKALQYYREAAKSGSAKATVKVSALKDKVLPAVARH